ncbi:MAG: YihY/virulence factor BrkB family protein [Bacteroidaceae bacterium]|nr:YihY/virulence factor BrkB family protein [Bacteroidaceae bacterium]
MSSNLKLSRIKKFLKRDIWIIDRSELDKRKARVLKYLKVTLLVIGDVARQKIGLRGVALAFFSVMALVPGVAMTFAVTNGFGIDDKLAELMLVYFSDSEDLVQQIMGYANNILAATGNGIFGIVTFLSFIWLVFWLMIQVENAFNYVWKAEKSRNLWKRVSFYIVFTLLFPLVLIMFMATVFQFINGDGLVSLLVNIPFWDKISKFVSWLLIYILTSFVLTLMFKFIPSPKVNLGEAWRASLVTAFFFCLFQFLYVAAQVAFNRWNSVFGAVAAIPFLMVWLNISWQIVLYGAELAYAFQHVDDNIPAETEADGKLSSD